MTILKKAIRSQCFKQLMGVFFASIPILFGVATLLKGNLGYPNYWGGMVFAPFAIVLGMFGLFAVLFRWQKLTQKPDKLKGQAARRARRASEYRSAIDDYNKMY